jgi:hypothetical protein
MPHTPAGPRRVRGVGEYPGAAAGGRSASTAYSWRVRSSHCYKSRPFLPTGIEGIARLCGTFCDGIDAANELSGRAHLARASPQAPRPR